MNDTPDPLPEASPELPDPAHPLLVTEVDGDLPSDCWALFQASGQTACGRSVFFHRNFRKWTIRSESPRDQASASQDEPWSFHPRVHEFPERLTAKKLIRAAAPHLTFSPDALLPMALDDPAHLEELLRQGADPNRQPAILRHHVATICGRMPLVILDERITRLAAGLQGVYNDLPVPAPSGVECLENLTGLHVTDPTRYRETHLSGRVDAALERLQNAGRCRQLLREAGAFEVSDYIRAVRSHAFDRAEDFLSRGLPVDVLQSAGCTMLAERIFARDDIAVEWLLQNGADPNFRPHALASMREAPVDAMAPVAEVCRQEHPRQIVGLLFEEVLGMKFGLDTRINLHDFTDWRDSHSASTGPFHPVLAALLADNQSAFETLLEHGADVHAVPVFHHCIPPDWAFPRLAALEIDWLQMGGPSYNRQPGVLVWRTRDDRPEWLHACALWHKHASPSERSAAEEMWQKRGW